MRQQQSQWTKLFIITVLAATLCSIGATGAGQKAKGGKSKRPTPQRNNSTPRPPSAFRSFPKRQGVGENVVWVSPPINGLATAYAPGGQLLAATIDEFGQVGLFRASDGALVRILSGHTSTVNSVAFSPDGSLIATASGDRTVKIFRVSDGGEVRTLNGHTNPVLSVAFSPDGTLIATGSVEANGTGTVRFFRVSDGSLLCTLNAHSSVALSVAFSPDGQLLASGSADQTVKLFRVSDGAEVRTLSGHADAVTDVAFSPDGTLLASASLDQTVKLFRVSDGATVRTIGGHPGGVIALAFSPDGATIATSSENDNTIKLFRVSDGSLARTLTGHRSVVGSVAFSPDGQFLASGGSAFIDPTERVWRVSDGADILRIGHGGSVNAVAFSANSQILAAGTEDGVIRFFSANNGVLQNTVVQHTDAVRSLAFSPDSQFLASASFDNTVKLFNASNGSVVRNMMGIPFAFTVAFSPDSQLLAVGSGDNLIRVFRVSDGSLVRSLTGHANTVGAVTFSPDGQFLASGGDNNLVNLYRVSDGSLARTFDFGNNVFSIAFTPDSQLLAVGGNIPNVRVFRVNDGTVARTLFGSGVSVQSLAISSDGQLLAAGNTGSPHLQLFRLSDGAEVTRVVDTFRTTNSVAFSPNSQFLATATAGIAVRQVGTGGGGGGFLIAEVPDVKAGRGREVTLDASASTSSGIITNFEWDLDNDGAFDDATGVQVRHTFIELGQFTIRVRVRDNGGREATDNATVTVIPDVDLVITSFTATPTTDLQDGTPVTLKAVVRNNGGEAVTNGFNLLFLAGNGGLGSTTISNLGAQSQTEVVIPARARGGADQFLAAVDTFNSVPELNELNNTRTIGISPIPAPDLTVSTVNLSPSDGVADGEPINVNATISNQGAATVNDVTATLLVDGAFFGATTLKGLGSGQSQNVTLPFNVRGDQRTVRVVADIGDQIGESNEANNAREAALPPIALPDLTVTDVTTEPSSGLELGQSYKLRATVRNNGASTKMSFRVEFRVAGITFSRVLPGLVGGQSQVVEFTHNASFGQQTLRVTTDTTQAVTEANENNNSAEFNFSVAGPDIVVSEVKINPPDISGLVSGEEVSVVATIQIVGSGRLTHNVAVTLNDNDKPFITPKFLDAGLKAGQTVTISFPWFVLPGNHTLRVVADPRNDFPEPNENNNSGQQVVNVGAPDLALAVSLLPESPQTGQIFRVQGQVKNLGAATSLNFHVKVTVLDANNRLIEERFPIAARGLPANGTLDVLAEFQRLLEMKTIKVEVLFTQTASIAAQFFGNRIGDVPPLDANPANNVVTFTLPDVPPPDYALTGVESIPPNTAAYGLVVTFRIGITNRGGTFRIQRGTFVQGIPIAVFLNEHRLGTAFIGGLDANVSTTVDFKWVIDQPVTNPTIRAVFDPDRAAPDANRGNNEAQSAVNLVVSPVDFQPVVARITPDNVPAGGLAKVEATIRKLTGPDYDGRVSVEAIVDGVSSGAQTFNLRFTNSAPDAKVSLPYTVTPGNVRNVRVVVDPRNELPEVSEGNNALDANVNYPAAAPDFVVSGVSFTPQTNVQQGNAVRFTLSIRNAGAGAWGGLLNVRVKFNTGFQRAFTLGSFAAGETKTVEFDWFAAPGSDHLLTVELDPPLPPPLGKGGTEGVVPESNETNNIRDERLPLTVAQTAQLQLTFSPPTNNASGNVAPGDLVILPWQLLNRSAVEGQAELSVSGLPEGAATVEPAVTVVPANSNVKGAVRVNVPGNLSAGQVFFVRLRAQVGAAALISEQELTVSLVPVIFDNSIFPCNNERTGSTTVTFQWSTQLVASSEVFIKRPVDPDFQRFEGEPGALHRVTVSNLRRNSTYLFFVRSVGTAGEARSEERRIFVTNTLAFTQDEFSQNAKRDYDQRLPISIFNADSKPHKVMVEVADNPHPDAVVGLIGPGTFDEAATLLPGQRLTVTFASHFQDARGSDYTFRLRLRTVGESEELVDESLVRVKVRQPDTKIRIQQLSEDPTTFIKTFRATNVGADAATDLTINPEDFAEGNVFMQPQIEHAFLGAGQSIEFKVIPQLLPPGFRPFSPSDVIEANLTFENSTTSDVVPFDLFLRFNGVEVGALQNTIPNGTFTFPIPPNVLFPPEFLRFSRVLTSPIPSLARRGTERTPLLNKEGMGEVAATNKNVFEAPPDVARKMMTALQSGTHLQVRYANRTERVPISLSVKRQQGSGERLFVVDCDPDAPKLIHHEIKATHCINQFVVGVQFNTGYLTGQVILDKSNFNKGHFFNASNFKLDICTGKFQIAVFAKDEADAAAKAKKLCEELTKRPPKPKAVSVTFVGNGPPFKRTKPVKVRAQVSGEGELSFSVVTAAFDNGDSSIILNGVGPNVFEGTWVPRAIPNKIKRDGRGNILFPVTVTVTATGCGQTATSAAVAQVQASDRIKLTILKINNKPPLGTEDNPRFEEEIAPGGRVGLTIVGKVEDADGNPVTAFVGGDVSFRPTASGSVFVSDLSFPLPPVETQNSGAFVIESPKEGLFSARAGELKTFNLAGDVTVRLTATASAGKDADSGELVGLEDSKQIDGIIRLGKVQLQVKKDGFRALKFRRDGQEISSLPTGDASQTAIAPKEVTIDIPDSASVRDVLVTVIAPQRTTDGRLVTNPLKDAIVQLIGAGQASPTDENGKTKITLNEQEKRDVELLVTMFPELQVKIISVPEGYLGRADAQGQLTVLLGKELGEAQVNPQTGAVTVSGINLIQGRRFRVTVTEGRTDSGLAVPASDDPRKHVVTYHPPVLDQDDKAAPDRVEVTITVEDEELPYTATKTVRVFKNAFLTFQKRTANGESVFKEPEPTSIDLVAVNKDVKVLPGSIEGRVQVFETPLAGRPVNGVKVTAVTPDGQKDVATEGPDGPEGGQFKVVLDPQRPPLSLKFKPFLLPFADVVENVDNSVFELSKLGYTTPRFRDQDGFTGVFPYRFDLRFETDPAKLQRILDAVKRMDAAAQMSAEVHQEVKQYLKDMVGGVVEVVLFFFDLKFAANAAERIALGKGIGVADELVLKLPSNMRGFLRQKIPGISEQTLDIIEKNARRFGEFNDQAVQSVVDDVRLITGNDNVVRQTRDFLEAERINLVKRPVLTEPFRDFLRQKIPGVGDQTLDIIENNVRKSGGLTDDAIRQIEDDVRLITGNDATAREISRGLRIERDRLTQILGLPIDLLKGEITNFIKGVLMTLTAGRIEEGASKEVLFIVTRILDAILPKVQEMLGSGIPDLKFIQNEIDKIANGIADFLLGLNHRGKTQTLFDRTIKQLGRYDVKGDTATLLQDMQAHRQIIPQIRKEYETFTNPLTSLIAKNAGRVQSNAEILSGERAFWKGALEFTTGVLDDALLLKAGSTVKLAPAAIQLVEGLESDTYKDAVGDAHAPFDALRVFNAIVSNLTIPTFSRTLSSKRQGELDEYTSLVNQVKAALQAGNYEAVLNLTAAVSQAGIAVNEVSRMKEAALLQAVSGDAAVNRPEIPRLARQASDAVDQAFKARYKFTLLLNSFLTAEAEDSSNLAAAAADDVVRTTQSATAALDTALQQLSTLGVSVPALLYVNHREQRVSRNELRVTFLVTNVGGQASAPTPVKLIATSGLSLNLSNFSVPALQPGATHSIVVTIGLPNNLPGGIAFVRTEPENFDVDLIPTIVSVSVSDTVPPVISDFTPSPNSRVRSARTIVGATATDALPGLDVSATRLLLDGQAVSPAFDPTSHRLSFQATNLAEGPHTVAVEARDFDGNLSRQEWQFTVDLSSPVEVTDVNFLPNPFSPNGDNMDETVQVHFKVSGDATLTVAIADADGNVIKTLAKEEAFLQGEHILNWDGTTDDNQPAPDGNYNILITVGSGARAQATLAAGQNGAPPPRKLQVKYQTAQAEQGVSLTRNPLNITGVSLSTDKMRLSKQTALLTFNLSKKAQVQVKVFSGQSTDDEGFLVRALSLPNAVSGQNAASWDGRDDQGRFVPPGPYTFAMEADGVTSVASVPFAGRVDVQSLPDLLLVSLTAQEINGQTKLTAAVRNVGGAEARNVVVRFFHKDAAIGDVTIAQLTVGEETTVELSPNLGVLNTQDVAVVVDPDERVDELEEANNRLQGGQQTQPDTTRVTQVLSAGLSMVSVPLRLLDASPTAAFGFASLAEAKVAGWDALGLRYQLANEIATIEIGRGFFIKLPTQRTIQWEGTAPPVDQPFVIRLQPGFNLVGNPFLTDIVWDLNAIKVRVNGQTRPLKDALDVMEDFAWGYQQDANNLNTGKYVLIYDGSIIPGITNRVNPVSGFWVLAKVACELILPAPNSVNASRALSRRKFTRNDWLVTFSAQTGEAKDSVYFGASSEGRSGKLQVPKPPIAPGQENVQVFLIPAEESSIAPRGRLGVDVRRSLADKEEWHLVVRSAQPNADVTLQWSDLGNAPRPLRFRLIDEATGTRRYMRTLNGYTFRSGAAGEERKFRIELDTASNAGRLLNHMSVLNNGAAGGAHFSFVLSQPATVNARIITPTGKVAAVVARGMEAKQGLNTLTWNGKNASGAAMGRGVYIVEVSAVTEEGQEMREVRTFTMR